MDETARAVGIVAIQRNTMADLSNEIETNASKPKRVQTDGVSVDARSTQEQIDADRYLASKAAAKSPKRGLNVARLSPPGAV